MNDKTVSQFFSHELPNYALYDVTRKICSFGDGLKISMRKILYTMMCKFPGNEKIKTDTVSNMCAAYTNYLHGSANLASVCNTLTQNFVGANNYALLEGNTSGFGSRINPTCSSSRYTKIALSPICESLFNKDDLQIVEQQFFEGTYIEPKYFIPTFPILFLNGSHGLSTGFAQDIYPRNPNEVMGYINTFLEGKKYTKELLPWFRGFLGSVRRNVTTGKLECLGVITKNNMTSYTITEIPIGIEYQKYIEILDKLCDDNVIVDYEDLCDTKTDTIKFDIKTTREFTRKYDTDEKVMNVLKLIKSLPETLCCIDGDNKVKEYTSITEILDDFIELRIEGYKKRKEYIIGQLTEKIELLNSKLIFCKSIIDGSLVVANKKKDEIIEQLEKIDGIIKVEDNYNYLLNMPIHSISYETVKKLEKDIKELKDRLSATKKTSIEDMWRADLEDLKKYL